MRKIPRGTRKSVAFRFCPTHSGQSRELEGVVGLKPHRLRSAQISTLFRAVHVACHRETRVEALQGLSRILAAQGWHRSNTAVLQRMEELRGGVLLPSEQITSALAFVRLGHREAERRLKMVTDLEPSAIGKAQTLRAIATLEVGVRLEQFANGAGEFCEAASHAFSDDGQVIASALAAAQSLDSALGKGEAEPLLSRIEVVAHRLMTDSETSPHLVLRLAEYLGAPGAVDCDIDTLRLRALRGALLQHNLSRTLALVTKVKMLPPSEAGDVERLIKLSFDARALARARNAMDGREAGIDPEALRLTQLASRRAKEVLETYKCRGVQELSVVVAALMRRDPLLAMRLATQRRRSGHYRWIVAAQLLQKALHGRSEEAHAGLQEIALQDPSDMFTWTIVRFASVRAFGPSRRDIDIFESLEMSRPQPAWVRTTLRHLSADLGMADGINDVVPTSGRGDREKRRQPARTLADLSGLSVLLVANEGVSDEVRHFQNLSALQPTAASIAATCDPRLHSLLERSFPDVRFIPTARQTADWGEVNEAEDLWRAQNLDYEAVVSLSELSAICRSSPAFENRGTLGYLTGRSRVAPTERTDELSLRVGLQWRSGNLRGLRSLMYPRLEELTSCFSIERVEFVSLQHMATEEEHALLQRYGVRTPQIDFYNDFEGIVGISSSLDLVIGVSSLPIELSAAAGTPVWMLGFSPETYYWRTNGGRTDCDVLTVNSTIIGPSDPRAAFARGDRVALRETVARVRSRLETMVKSSLG